MERRQALAILQHVLELGPDRLPIVLEGLQERELRGIEHRLVADQRLAAHERAESPDRPHSELLDALAPELTQLLDPNHRHLLPGLSATAPRRQPEVVRAGARSWPKPGSEASRACCAPRSHRAGRGLPRTHSPILWSLAPGRCGRAAHEGRTGSRWSRARSASIGEAPASGATAAIPRAGSSRIGRSMRCARCSASGRAGAIS